ncbi:MAG: M15 family metallopeptidase [Micrococcaceae bacterium]
MIIPKATLDTTKLDLFERSKYFFLHLANQTKRKDNGEKFIGRTALEKAGFIIEPFWETPEDMEGDTYHGYIKEHREFDLMVRQGVFERLIKAQQLLPDSWNLVLKAGFRPYSVQLELLDAFIESSKLEYPNYTEEEHLEQARTYIADPRIGCPPHVTGGAVDVDIKDAETGEYVDMGCIPNTDYEISFLHSDLVTAEQRANRQVLLKAMLKVGFSPNPNEWWHYQYGDTIWAAFYGHKETLYDLITQ